MLNPVMIEAIGSLAALITTLCWIPQAWRVIRTRETRAISLPAQVALLIGVGMWLVYGVLMGIAPLVWSNVVTFALVAVIVAMKLRFG
ncbi:SemiSWEET transporter [Alsobacter sp. KACC 23698]|uniref:SemiSWEET transporter n=1 Tax=Alsobacter sp. KACC 23698 TaxID=3149229 RepID=A0AAU7JBP1_9HYPH